MKTADLINQLASSAAPVKLKPAWRRAGATLGVTAALCALIFLFVHIRPDLGAELGAVQFLLGGAVLLVSWLIFGTALSLLATPGRKTHGALTVGGLTLGALVVGYVAHALGSHMDLGAGLDPSGARCSLDIVVLGLLPAAATFFRAKKGAPVNLPVTGAVIGLLCASIGAFALQFSCPSDHPMHLLAWHILVPCAALAGAGALLARRLLRW